MAKNKPAFSEQSLYQWATATSIERGYDYYERGAVQSLVRRGNELRAQVWGTDVEPYRVRVVLDAHGIPSHATCTCPYDWGGWCKHIVATLLTYLHEPEKVEVRPPLEEMVKDLSDNEMRELLSYLVSRAPATLDLIDAWFAIHDSEEQQASPTSAPWPPHPEPYERRARAILHSLDHMLSSEAYWHVSEVFEELEDMAQQAKTFLNQGDQNRALSVLIGVTNAYVSDAFYLDDSDGIVSDFAYQLGELWASLLVRMDLDDEARKGLQALFEEWEQDLVVYGLEDVWESAEYTVSIQSEEDILESDDPVLILAYLEHLEQVGDDEAYLRFALEASEYGHYVVKLIHLGRLEEAKAFLDTHQLTTGEKESVVYALYEEGHVEEAFTLAEDLMSAQDASFTWFSWLADRAETAGRKELALRAVEQAFRRSPSLTLYYRARDLAGADWPRVREELLAFLRTEREAGIDVFIAEELWDDVLRALEEGYVDYSTLRRVVDALIPHRPEAAARIAQEQAERIMDAGLSKAYPQAVEWLQRMRQVYHLMGRDSEWQAYLESLIQKHRRKYTLRPLLEELR